ncbi:DNA binding protein [Streptomyces phage Evy]|uniref:DNA binding protein n=1 Tax=Streptomyces phage Evy TaxID=2588514 RepID=A0A514DK25_9CAUD|nr:single strand DNA binding protein [Streptomyces phage Evy]QDH93946.1 DNA binding protein [Streptomyces phage Evy]
MGTLKGLAAIRAHNEKQAQAAKEREARLNSAKVEYLSLNDGQSVKVRFLQEMDAEAKNYDKARGVGVGVVEHSVYDKANRRMYRTACLMDDEGRCYGCERYRAGDKDYSTKRNYYINVLVDAMDGEAPKTMVLSRSLGSSFFEKLITMHDLLDSITEHNFKVTRTGTSKDTKWDLQLLKGDAALDDSEAVVHDIDNEANGIIRRYPYEATSEKASQEQYFAGETYKQKEDGASESGNANSGGGAKSSGYNMDESW